MSHLSTLWLGDDHDARVWWRMRKILIITGAAIALAWFLTAWPLLIAGYMAMDSTGDGFGYWAYRNWDAICLYAFAPIFAFMLFAGVFGILSAAVSLLKL